jgi:circadian clock protein KaiC
MPKQPAQVAYPVALTKTPTGITGFDEIATGGLPRGRTTLISGGPGCGKTIFALQTLVNRVRDANESAIFVAFEESSKQIMTNAATFGWDLAALQRKKKLFLLDAVITPDTITAGEFDLVGMLEVLGQQARAMKANCIVFDGLDVLLGLLNDPVLERREVYRLSAWLAEAGLTGMLTAKNGGSDALAEKHYGFMQFMVDCVVTLKHQVLDGSAFRTLRIMKYRGSGFSGDEFPVSLTREGLHLVTRGPPELKYKVTNARVSSGVPRLDNMLSGGYHRGTNILISGAPGTAKSTLSGAFSAAACARGERTLYVSFDESSEQIVRNLASVNIRLAPHVKTGLLKMYSTRTRGPNVNDQFGDLRAMVREFKPTCLVIDPLSALSGKVVHVASADATQQFLDFLKGRYITVINTSLMSGMGTDEDTATGISVIADTWIHLSYVVQDGERNRALTIVKSRGTGHSNQVRELTLSNKGVNLTDVFIAQGKVLMGVARWEREQQELADKKRTRVDSELKHLQLRLAQAEAAARLQVIQTEMESRSAELDELASATGSASDLVKSNRAVLGRMRGADVETGDHKSKNGHLRGNNGRARPAAK